jgi:hypothetical protein
MDTKVKYRVVHVPQIGSKAGNFVIENIKSPAQGYNIMQMLAYYDLFQFHHKIKPDYCNACFFEYFDEEEKQWMSWYDEDGREIDEHFEECMTDEEREKEGVNLAYSR